MTDLFENMTTAVCPHCDGTGSVTKKVSRGERLTAARKSVGLSQADIAAALGRSLSHVCRAEGDKVELRLREYKVLSELYGMKVSDLLGPLDD